MDDTERDAARRAIERLLHRYADAVNRRDADAWIACWSDDPTWTLMGHEVRGREAVLEMWRGAMGGFPFVAHIVHAPLIEPQDAGHARIRCYVQELLALGDGGGQHVFGVYHDTVVAGEAGWRFESRRFDILMRLPLEMSGAEFPAFPDGLEGWLGSGS